MMKKILILGAILCLLAGVSVFAQNAGAPVPSEAIVEIAPPTPTPSPTPTATPDSGGEAGEVAPEGAISELQLLTMGTSAAQIQKESEEPEKPVNILDRPEVRRLLKDSPSFIYNPKDLKDPMIVPWIRNTLLVKEFLDTMEEHLKRNRAQEAQTILRQIEELLPEVTDMELKVKVDARVAAAKKLLADMAAASDGILPGATQTPPPVPTPDIVIPGWIRANVAGVMWQPKAEERMVLIGDEILKEGQPVPRYPEAKIEKINPNSVVISYRGVTEEISVESKD